MSNTLEKVQEVVAEGLNVKTEEIKMETTLEELGADSLDTVELVMNFEEVFDIEIEDEKAEDLKTIEDIVNYVDEKLA